MNTNSAGRSKKYDAPWGGSMTLLAVLMLLAPFSAFAYVDPGTGTILWQMLLGLVVGVSFYSRRIIGWLTKKRR